MNVQIANKIFTSTGLRRSAPETANSLKCRKGFTIIELMIATTVFSFVLIVASSGVIAIGRLYYKGITNTRTQEAARTVMEDVSRSLQFSGTSFSDNLTPLPPEGTPKARCFDQVRYTYIINQRHAGAVRGLWRDQKPAGPACPPSNYATGGEELLGNNMRLLQFDVTNSDPYQIRIKIAYGDDDLLSIYNDDGSRPGGLPILESTVSTALCKTGFAGSNFCSVAGLETVVTKRIQ